MSQDIEYCYGQQNTSLTNLGERFPVSVVYIICVPDIGGPGANCPDVEAKVLLVRGGSQCERMVLTGAQLRARDSDPLTRVVLEV